MCKSNYKHVEFSLTQLEFKITFNDYIQRTQYLTLKNGQSIYNGKIFGQFAERPKKPNAYFRAMW